MSHPIKRFALAASFACSLLGGSCNEGLEGQGDNNDGGGAQSCDCTAPQVCSKAPGAGCIAPGGCGGDVDCEAGKQCVTALDGSKSCAIGGKCGGQELMADAVPPNLLLVLDRSCSMQDKVGAKTKWDIAVAAIKTLTTTYRDKIRFGLTLFPDTVAPNCGQSTIPIPVGPGKEAMISTMLTSALNMNDPLFPKAPCVTNIDTAMQQAATEPAFKDLTRGGFATLITDGKQSDCKDAGGDAGTTTIITDLYKKQKVPTFVVGFGSGVDEAQMNAFAKAGGVPAAGASSYYKAEDQMSLDAALATIASKTIGCELQLKQSPPNPMQLYVFFGTDRVARDVSHKNGWDYDGAKNRVIFYGQACDDLRSGKVKDLHIVFGCDLPTPG